MAIDLFPICGELIAVARLAKSLDEGISGVNEAKEKSTTSTL